MTPIETDVPGRGPERLKFFGLCMSQNQNALAAFNMIFEEYGPFKQIIEIGTGNGGLSVLFHIYALTTGARFTTFDNKPRNNQLLQELDVDCWHGSCWDFQKDIALMIRQPGRTFVFCDGGNKPKELTVFSEHLKSGDLIAVHDYAPSRDFYKHVMLHNIWDWCEVTWEMIEPAVNKYGLEVIEQQIGWLSAMCILQKK